MNNNNSPILVTGGTGAQGGATARALLAAGYTVRILARSPDSPAAQALLKRRQVLLQVTWMIRRL